MLDQDAPALNTLLNPRRGVLERGDADPEVLRRHDDLAGPEVNTRPAQRVAVREEVVFRDPCRSTEIFQFWTSLSASPESPRASSVAITENV
jgi:hypothetical protein